MEAWANPASRKHISHACLRYLGAPSQHLLRLTVCSTHWMQASDPLPDLPKQHQMPMSSLTACLRRLPLVCPPPLYKLSPTPLPSTSGVSLYAPGDQVPQVIIFCTGLSVSPTRLSSKHISPAGPPPAAPDAHVLSYSMPAASSTRVSSSSQQVQSHSSAFHQWHLPQTFLMRSGAPRHSLHLPVCFTHTCFAQGYIYPCRTTSRSTRRSCALLQHACGVLLSCVLPLHTGSVPRLCRPPVASPSHTPQAIGCPKSSSSALARLSHPHCFNPRMSPA